MSSSVLQINALQNVAACKCKHAGYGIARHAIANAYQLSTSFVLRRVSSATVFASIREDAFEPSLDIS